MQKAIILMINKAYITKIQAEWNIKRESKVSKARFLFLLAFGDIGFPSSYSLIYYKSASKADDYI